MEQHVKDKFSQKILKSLTKRYGIQDDGITLLDGFESFIYEFKRDGQEYILRIGHSSRRSFDLITGEVDWINYLVGGGVGAAKGVHSQEGELVEAIDDGHGGQFLATAFERANGDHPRGEMWNDRFFERYGVQIGRMHKLSKIYQPADPAWRRLEWDDPVNLNLAAWLPKSEGAALEKFNELLDYLNILTKSKDNYGLIHQDAHAGNLFIDDDYNITLFDFDDCCYGWYTYDIAMVLFYAVGFGEDMAERAEAFMRPFLKGYRRENQVEPYWLDQIPHFLKLREIDLYAVIHRDFDVDNLDDPWVERFMASRKEKICYDVPFIDLDFTTFAK
jgi:Ser/Thr protein kinase RdoA (MazF antagonist)